MQERIAALAKEQEKQEQELKATEEKNEAARRELQFLEADLSYHQCEARNDRIRSNQALAWSQYLSEVAQYERCNALNEAKKSKDMLFGTVLGLTAAATGGASLAAGAVIGGVLGMGGAPAQVCPPSAPPVRQEDEFFQDALKAEGLNVLPSCVRPVRPPDLASVATPSATSPTAATFGIDWVSADGLLFSKREVTNREYAACVSAGKCSPTHEGDGSCAIETTKGPAKAALPAVEQGANYPAVCVDHAAAQAFCAATGARLPSTRELLELARSSSAERAITTSEGKTCPHANVADRSAKRAHPNWVTYECDDGKAGLSATCGVGGDDAGFCDLVGNAWEWTSDGDLVGGSFDYERKIGRDPLLLQGQGRTLRDGAVGFRCALAP